MSRPIADIQSDLTAAYAARRKALEAEKYSLNSGQGSQTAERNLAAINATIVSLEREMDDAQSSDLGIIAVDVRRY
jgi:hypothetical protein